MDPSSLADLEQTDFAKLAIGEPLSVPAGSYAKEALMHEGLWGELESKLVFAKDVRQVLAYVETGNAEAGFHIQDGCPCLGQNEDRLRRRSGKP